MAIFRTGNIWDHYEECDHLCITTNATTTTKGKLVMGAGIAKQARDMFKGIDSDFGEQIKNAEFPKYGLLFSQKFPKLIAFQVKFFYAEDARYDLIDFSSEQLMYLARENPDKTYFLNYPGIGNGGLLASDVAPLLESLPDNVTVWSYE